MSARRQLLQGRRRFSHIHKYQPAHQSVEVAPQIQCPGVPRHEFDVGEPHVASTRSGCFDNRGIEVHTYDPTVGTD